MLLPAFASPSLIKIMLWWQHVCLSLLQTWTIIPITLSCNSGANFGTLKMLCFMWFMTFNMLKSYQKLTNSSRHPTILNLNLCCQRSVASPQDWVPQPVSHSLSAPIVSKVYQWIRKSTMNCLSKNLQITNEKGLQTKKNSILPETGNNHGSGTWMLFGDHPMHVPVASCAFPCSVTAPYDLDILNSWSHSMGPVLYFGQIDDFVGIRKKQKGGIPTCINLKVVAGYILTFQTKWKRKSWLRETSGWEPFTTSRYSMFFGYGMAILDLRTKKNCSIPFLLVPLFYTRILSHQNNNPMNSTQQGCCVRIIREQGRTSPSSTSPQISEVQSVPMSPQPDISRNSDWWGLIRIPLSDIMTFKPFWGSENSWIV